MTTEKWRNANDVLDMEKDLAAAFGCVGQPVVKVLSTLNLDRETVDQLCEAAQSARVNIAGLVAERAQDEVDTCLADLVSTLYACDGDIDTEMTISEIYSAGYEACENEVENFSWQVAEIDPEAL